MPKYNRNLIGSLSRMMGDEHESTKFRTPPAGRYQILGNGSHASESGSLKKWQAGGVFFGKDDYMVNQTVME